MGKIISGLIVVVLGLFTFQICSVSGGLNETGEIPIRVAYPTATLTNGQVGQVLLKTNILEKNNLRADIKGFQYGAPMMEALLSDKVDVSFTSEVPASLPLSKGHKATIIATFGHLGRGAIMVLKDSPVRQTGDLKGKKIGIPFGSSPHRNLLGMLRKAGLKPGEDVQVLNVGRDEVAPGLIRRGLDAIMIWDPAVEQYRRKNNFRIIEAEPFYSVVIMNDKFIERYPDGAINFIRSLKEAVFFWVTHKDQVDKWFGEVSRLDPEIIKICSRVNSNYRYAKKISDINVALSDDFLDMMEKSAEFTATQKMVSPFDISKAINPTLKKEAAKKIDDSLYVPSDIIVVTK